MSPAALHRARRPLFLAISAAVVLAIAICAHEVLLPFVLATVIAYVLTPLVALAERRGIRRGLAVLLVYGIVLGSPYNLTFEGGRNMPIGHRARPR